MSWNTKTSKIYPLRIKNSQRYKAQAVANSKGRKLSEHLHWLINQSVTNYEIEFGEINVPKEEE